VLGQSQMEIGETETSGALHDRLSHNGAVLMRRVLTDLAAGRATETLQDETWASSAPKISRQDARLDWTQSAQTIARRIRAFWPWPGCHVRLLDAVGGELAKLSLASARAAEGEGSRWKDGEIDGGGRISVAGGAEAVEILEIQPEGRRAMSFADFRRGHAWMPGMRLE